jgi:hypothetical protein
MKFEWTPERKSQLTTLRSEGRSHAKCAVILGCSENQVFKQLHPKPPKPRPRHYVTRSAMRQARKLNLNNSGSQIKKLPLLPRILHSHWPPRTRPPNPYRAPEMTKPELVKMFEDAWANTARL